MKMTLSVGILVAAAGCALVAGAAPFRQAKPCWSEGIDSRCHAFGSYATVYILRDILKDIDESLVEIEAKRRFLAKRKGVAIE